MEEKENKVVIEEHNASFDEDPIADTADMSAEELQDSILADSDLNGFQRFIAKMDDKKWKLAQRILGVVLGLSTGLALFSETIFQSGEGSLGSYSLLIAVVIALLIPNLIEKQGGRRINLARITMAITLLIVLVAYFAFISLSGGLTSK